MSETSILEEIRTELAALRTAVQRPPRICFSVEETAEMTGLSQKHVIRAIQRGELECSDVASEGAGRRKYRITPQAISAWLDSKRVRRGPSRSARKQLVDKFFGKTKQTSAV